MPRANRLRVDGGVFHLTHRCHDRAFLLKFARDREAYRARMRAKLREFEVFLLDYCLTCNHVHLLAEAEDSLEEVRANLEAVLEERIERDELKREPCWTESLAVGSPEFGLHRGRTTVSHGWITCSEENEPWMGAYNEFSPPAFCF